MKILIEMHVAIYDGFIDKLERTSRAYAVLKNGLIVADSDAGDNERVLEIACDRDEATLLLDSATRLYPDAAPVIAAAIDRVPPL